LLSTGREFEKRKVAGPNSNRRIIEGADKKPSNLTFNGFNDLLSGGQLCCATAELPDRGIHSAVT
jgi:hypothetical protein